MRFGWALTNYWEVFGDASGGYFEAQHRPLEKVLHRIESIHCDAIRILDNTRPLPYCRCEWLRGRKKNTGACIICFPPTNPENDSI